MGRKKKAAEDTYQPPTYHKTLDDWRMMLIADAHKRAIERRVSAQEGLPDEQRTA